jgi:tetratricopeptide (TPR) repeat protein
MDDGLLRSAHALQQVGNLTEAARLYGEIARANPKNFDALCLLGMAQAQLGQREDAQRVADEALRGGTFAGRVASSLLGAIGLNDMIADSPQTYEATALKLARDTQAIRAIRARLTTNRETHPLFDTIRFTRNLEKAYVEMWARAERAEAPEHFAVESVP